MTDRHRLDCDDSDSSEGEVGLGEVTASPEHYCEVLATLKTEMATRRDLEAQVADLRTRRETATASTNPAVVLALERALEAEEHSRKVLAKSLDCFSAETWYGGFHFGIGAH